MAKEECLNNKCLGIEENKSSPNIPEHGKIKDMPMCRIAINEKEIRQQNSSIITNDSKSDTDNIKTSIDVAKLAFMKMN